MTLDGRVLVVRSFLLGACCTNCQRLITQSKQFERLIEQAIGPAPAYELRSDGAVRQVDDKAERGFGLYVCLAWFVMGAGCCWFWSAFWSAVVGWLGGAK